MKNQQKIIAIISIFLQVLLFNSCSTEDTLESDPFVIAFQSLSANLSEIANEESIPIVFSQMAMTDGSFLIEVDAINAIYGKDFVTIPAIKNNNITLPIEQGEFDSSVIFKKLNPDLDETSSLTFSITAIDYNNSNIQGNSNFVINTSASLGGAIFPNTGGPNQQNQVFVDLSSQKSTARQRDSWDLGFYGGNEFRVVINGSIYMATKSLGVTDINAISENDIANLKREVAIGTFDPANEAYIDGVSGDIQETAINEISINDLENKVYLVNLGYTVGTAKPNPGSAAIAGDPRGWKKIRILRDGENYKLQYADLNDTTYQEVIISKNPDYNFTHFSLDTNQTLIIEPEKEKWDLCFTVFSNVIPGSGSYGFSDFVTHNRKGNVTAYLVDTENRTYEDFTVTDVDYSLFSKDQTIIGSSWRSVFSGGSVFADKFYIIKDSNENIYKLKFLAITNSNGERGHPEFEYQLLQ